MVDYIDAIKRPFTDLKKSGLAALFIFIPIVNFLSLGYFLECAKYSSKNKKELPEWGNYWEKFVRGFFFFLINLVYFIPFTIVFIYLIFKFFNLLIGSEYSGIVMGLSTGNFNTIISNTIKLIFNPNVIGYWVLGLVLLIIASYILPMALMLYTTNWSFKDAFNFSEIFKRIFTKKYFSGWVVASVYNGFLNIILGFVPFVGGMVSATLSGITSYTIYGNVYKEIKA